MNNKTPLTEQKLSLILRKYSSIGNLDNKSTNYLFLKAFFTWHHPSNLLKVKIIINETLNPMTNKNEDPNDDIEKKTKMIIKKI